jgi:hypothetical protein
MRESFKDNAPIPCPRSRRTFLKNAGVAGGGLLASHRLGTALGGTQEKTDVLKGMPKIPFGSAQISRLVLGSNPVRGTTHTFGGLRQILREYYTVEKVIELLWTSERAGITHFQTEATPVVFEALRRYQDQGGKIRFIATVTEDFAPGDPRWPYNPKKYEEMFAIGPASANVIGTWASRCFRQGKMELIHDQVKKLHDRGFPTGLAMHTPQTLEYAVEKDWEVDWYMPLAYHISRTPEEWQEILGDEKPLGEVYLPKDPERLCSLVRQVPKQCFVFKILAAGRLARRPQSREAAFKFILENIKPIDGIVVGMSIMLGNEPKENAELTIKYGSSSAVTPAGIS